jgi:hypothetical protein
MKSDHLAVVREGLLEKRTLELRPEGREGAHWVKIFSTARPVLGAGSQHTAKGG